MQTELPGAGRPAGFISRSLVTAGTRLLDLPSRYGLHLLIAARLPVAEVGAFYIVFSVMTLAAGFGRLGVDRALTREVAGSLGRESPNTARKAIKRAFLVTLLQTGAIVALLAMAAAPLAIRVLQKPGLAVPLVLGALTILPQNISTTAAGALAGLGRVATSQMIYSWLWPALFCVAALAMPLDVQRTLLLIGVSLLINAAVGMSLMLKAVPPRESESLALSVGPFFGVGISFFSLELVQLSIAAAPSFVLGMYAATTTVGLYALAWRIVLILNIAVSAMAAIASPQFARAAALGRSDDLTRVAAQTIGLTLALSGIPIVLLAAKPVFFLDLFGKGYAPAAGLLRILLAGQTVLVLATAVPELLGMTGCARTLTRINVTSLVILLLCLGVLTPRYGSLGAAVATSATMAVNGIAVSIAAKRRLGFVPLFSLFGFVRRRFV
jgi:O-antigen/teichoic acid export membrane protein